MSIGSIWHGLVGRLYGLWFATVFAVLALLTALLLVFVPGEERRRRLTRWSARSVFRLTGCWPNIDGLQHLPSQAAVAVANHASYIDGILLTAVLPAEYRFVIKREITQLPVAHFLLRRIGSHFVERHDVRGSARDTRRIFQSASQGSSLAIFPEGTFRVEPGLQRFRNGAFVIATRGGLPLVPVAIRGTRAMLPANRWLPFPARLQVIIHEPLHDTAGQDIGLVMARCRERILASLPEPDLATPMTPDQATG